MQGSGGRSAELEQLFHQLYDRYFKDVYNFVAYTVGRSQDAEDLTQEVFVKAYRGLARFRGDSEVRTWLFAIARNTVRNWVVRKKPLPLTEDELLWQLPEHGSTPADLLEEKEAMAKLQLALGMLKDTYKTVIVLRGLHGFSVRETAEIMECTETKVKVTHFRALRKLRSLLSADPSFPILLPDLPSKEVGT
ncbi:RNA polymerase sigma factor [Tumebacillus sp. DT12]|uniref:RNA polymerase sigma factor n=1 Tax=Tumebacillus lacus TaxID=2995335 RepID=A0ABT3X700_9BACL|nr:RNA polymerase sigma factor [Tumebacillus lacus]MCX7571763.1 RNA polymerase sigma factor [Tumebacillus lacus]